MSESKQSAREILGEDFSRLAMTNVVMSWAEHLISNGEDPVSVLSVACCRMAKNEEELNRAYTALAMRTPVPLSIDIQRPTRWEIQDAMIEAIRKHR